MQITTTTISGGKTRFLSLDVMRGLIVTLMIIVNTPGTWSAIYTPFDHTVWHGCTPTDWVFPSFMFMIGVSMRFSFKPFGYQLDNALAGKILKRGAMIYLIYFTMCLFWKICGALIEGKTLNGDFFNTFFYKFRILGVLPRLALGYVLASFFALWAGSFRNVVYVIATLLLGYWAVMYAFGDYQMLTNAGHKIDVLLLGENHLWHGEGVAFDPEGLFSTLPSVATVLLGYLTGQHIQKNEDKTKIIKHLIIAGATAIVLSEVWNLVFPISKKMWTSSFVLHLAGVDWLILAILIWAIDLNHREKGTFFFKVFGMNALMAYVVSELPIPIMSYIKVSYEGKATSLYNYFYKSIFLTGTGGNANLASFLFAFTWMLICWVVLYWMYRKNWFLKV
jgi:predicted acyltransferase